MNIKPNIRGTIRSLEVGERFVVPFDIMNPDIVRTLASIVKQRENKSFRVNADTGKRISTVTRIS